MDADTPGRDTIVYPGDRNEDGNPVGWHWVVYDGGKVFAEGEEPTADGARAEAAAYAEWPGTLAEYREAH